MYKKYNVQVILMELDSLNTTLNTYQQVNDTLHNVLQQQNIILDYFFGLKNNDGDFNVFISFQKYIKIHLVQCLK